MTLTLATVDAWHRHAVESAVPAGRDQVTDAERVALLEKLEDLKNTLGAVQGDLAVDLDASQRAQQAAAGEPAQRQGRGVAHQVALARRESPHRGQVFLSVAKVLRAEMPHTADALRTGRVSEHHAMLLVRETACLSLEDRRWVDEAVCADEDVLVGVGTRQLIGMLRGHAARLDPAAVVRRNRKAESERTVSLRPAPDTMSYLTGALPVAAGVACWASLQQAVASAKAAGDERSKGQIMADTMVARLMGFRDGAGAPPQPPETASVGATGPGFRDGASAPPQPPETAGASAPPQPPETAGASAPPQPPETASAGAPPQPPETAGVPVTVHVVISDSSLFGAGHNPAIVPGFGPVPAEVARNLIANSMDSAAVQAFIRGLYADPHGRLIAMTTKQRFHTDGIAEFLRLRDQGICRTPWCDAPIAESDHITTADSGGETTAENGQGLCVACNRAKQAPGWTQTTEPHAGRHQVETVTPTGHRYRSTAPRAPTPAERFTVDVIRWTDLVLSA